MKFREMIEAGVETLPLDLPPHAISPDAISTESGEEANVLTVRDGIATWSTIEDLIADSVDVNILGVHEEGFIKGDLIYAAGFNVLARRSIGASNTALFSNGSVPNCRRATAADVDAGTFPGASYTMTALVLNTPLAVTSGGLGLNTVATFAVLYASALNTYTTLAPNITTTRKLLSMTGTGAVGQAPTWDTITAADVNAGAFPTSAAYSMSGVLTLTAGLTVSAGPVTFSKTGVNDGELYLRRDVGSYWNIWFQTGTSNRWRLSVNATAEGGANAGSDLEISRRADDGTHLGFPFAINRATGLVTLASGLSATTGVFSGLLTANLGLTVASGQTLTVSGATITGLTAASVGAGTFPGSYSFADGAIRTLAMASDDYGLVLYGGAAADDHGAVLRLGGDDQDFGTAIIDFSSTNDAPASARFTVRSWITGSAVTLLSIYPTVTGDADFGLNVDVASGKVYKVNGTQVVGAQGAAVADPTGGAVIDAECRASYVALAARLRAGSGHGLFAA